MEHPGAGTTGAALARHAPRAVGRPRLARRRSPRCSSDGRVAFAVPWQDGLLLGTTDHPYDGDPADVAPDPGDERQILAEAGLSLTPATIDPARIRYRFAGLRVLPVAAGPTSEAPREVVLTTRAGRHGLDRRRQAHDLASHRAAGGRAGVQRAGPSGARPRGPCRCPRPSTRRRPAPSCAPGFPVPRTGRHRAPRARARRRRQRHPAAHRGRRDAARAAFCRRARTSARRCCTRATGNGRCRSTTSCAAPASPRAAPTTRRCGNGSRRCWRSIREHDP